MFASLVYNKTEGGMNSFTLTWPGTITDPLLPILYSLSTLEGVETYSDLEYSQVDLTLGGTFAFTENFYLAAQATYSKLEDNEAYVYGDLDADMIVASVGIGYRF
jgi:hypothetical protein